ncbi:MAG: lamin tail domain-containing protein [Candidatus Shapirobacteria bacterium]|jgi:hypothetical protein
MARKLNRILVILVVVCFHFLPSTNAYFIGQTQVTTNSVSSGCWLPPATPDPISPSDNSFVGQGASWLADPYFDWSNSISLCPQAFQISYQYESYSDSDLQTLLFHSTLLSDSQIPAPQTSDGVYYWRVLACDNLGSCSPWSSVQKLTIDTSAPSSEITDLPSSSSSSNFIINYLATGDNLDYVTLCYSWNLTPWICSPGFQDHPHSPGSFDFTSPKGDGTYHFATLAHDLAGNGENKNLSADPLAILSFPSTVVDTKSPTTNLNQSSFSDDHWTGQNLAINTWQIDPLSTGDHFIGSTSVEIGFSGAPLSEDALDAVYQIFSLPQNISSHLSFWFRGQSQDTVDFDQFQVQIRRPDDYLLEYILATGNKELPDSDTWLGGDSDWRWLSHPLLSYAGQTIKIWFGLTNRDSEPNARTWVELKDVVVSTLDPRLSGTDPVTIDTHDTGTGVGDTTAPFSTTVGENNLNIGATDNAGNSETPNSSSIVVLPPLVLNQISFNPSNQFIELYNNGSENIDLSGWYISQVGQTLSIGSTIISSKSSLKIENIDTSLFDFTDTSGTVDLISPLTTKVDSTTYFSAGHAGEVWQRLPDGIGNWGLYYEDVSGNIGFRLNVNRITLTIANIPSDFGANPADRLDYKITYTKTVDGTSLGQQIAGSISIGTIVNHRADRDFYLGTCSSGGACTPDSGLGANFVLSLTGQIGSESVNINQVFSP